MTDLLANPEAQTVNPAEARRIAQMQAEIARLQPTRKPSTTSFASTGDSSMQTVTRTSDVEDRRKLLATMAPLVDPTQVRWDQHEEHWRQIERRNEQQRVNEQAASAAADSARLAEINRELARKKARQAFDNAGAVVDLALADLSTAQRGRVMQRLLNEGDIHNADKAMAYALEEKYSSAPVVDTPQVDWRGGVVKKH
jgi:hypothetical protein